MPKIKVLPHAEICPQGAEFEAESGISVCENLLNQDIDLEVSLFESKLRLLLIHSMEERDKNKRLQQLNLLTPTTTN